MTVSRKALEGRSTSVGAFAPLVPPQVLWFLEQQSPPGAPSDQEIEVTIRSRKYGKQGEDNPTPRRHIGPSPSTAASRCSAARIWKKGPSASFASTASSRRRSSRSPSPAGSRADMRTRLGVVRAGKGPNGESG